MLNGDVDFNKLLEERIKRVADNIARNKMRGGYVRRGDRFGRMLNTPIKAIIIDDDFEEEEEEEED